MPQLERLVLYGAIAKVLSLPLGSTQRGANWQLQASGSHTL